MLLAHPHRFVGHLCLPSVQDVHVHTHSTHTFSSLDAKVFDWAVQFVTLDKTSTDDPVLRESGNVKLLFNLGEREREKERERERGGGGGGGGVSKPLQLTLK